MRKLLVLTLAVGMSIFLFVGCLSLNNEPILSLSYAEWHTTTEEMGNFTYGYVHLSLSGSTTGDKVTVITYGAGVIAELELGLDQDKKFAQDVIIRFTHSADDIPRKYSTVLTAYKGSYTTSINLESEELTYLK